MRSFTNSSRGSGIHAKRFSSRAFTLVELLVVLAVVAVLLAVKLPALTRAQGQSRQAQCAANLRQFALASHLYAGENGDKLPPNNTGAWPFIIDHGSSDLLGAYGAKRQQMYCPADPEQNVDGLWNFATQYRIIGYSVTFPNTGGLVASNANSSITPPQIVFISVPLPAPLAAQRVLLADVIISQSGQNNPAQKLNYSYTGIAGGYNAFGWQGHRTSHLDINGRYPAGANLAMLDGHVEWRKFADVTSKSGNTTPCFWW